MVGIVSNILSLRVCLSKCVLIGKNSILSNKIPFFFCWHFVTLRFWTCHKYLMIECDKATGWTKCCTTNPYLKVAVYPQAKKERKCYLNGPIPAPFCLFLFLSHYNFNTIWKKRSWCAWDSNPGQQDGRWRWNHGAMVATQKRKRFTPWLPYERFLN